jgi:hypothetical protein
MLALTYQADKLQRDPTSSLHPRNVRYLETYIWIQWLDGVLTWETRESFRYIMNSLTKF